MVTEELIKTCRTMLSFGMEPEEVQRQLVENGRSPDDVVLAIRAAQVSIKLGLATHQIAHVTAGSPGRWIPRGRS